jgi:hypothetical protein
VDCCWTAASVHLQEAILFRALSTIFLLFLLAALRGVLVCTYAETIDFGGAFLVGFR